MGLPKWLIEGKPWRIEELQTNVQKKLNMWTEKFNKNKCIPLNTIFISSPKKKLQSLYFYICHHI